MPRPTITLTDKESKLLSSIPSAAKAAAIWAEFEARKQAAKEDRLALGHELIAVQSRLSTKGCKGLFTRWLQVMHIPHDRAYAYIALAGGGKRKTDTPSYKRKITLIGFSTQFRTADTNPAKVTILRDLITYLSTEFDIHAKVSIKESK